MSNFRIDQLKATELSIAPQTILNLPDTITSRAKFEGLTLIRITDSSIQLQKISGVSVVLRRNKPGAEAPMWAFSSATLQGLEATVSKEDGADLAGDVSGTLFGNAEIPTYYYRSCLLSPKFFSVINKQVAKIVSDGSFNAKLRLRVMAFLKKIMRTDAEFTSLILKEIDLEAFLRVNIIGDECTTIQQASEFLQSFQAEKDFSLNLYEILIQLVERLPETYTPVKGYEAIIGMLKWALPLDYQRTLDVLLDVFYRKVTIEKVKQAQTAEQVYFRTRCAAGLPATVRGARDVYPFDTRTFKLGDAKGKQGGGEAEADEKAASKAPSGAQKRHDILRHFSLTQHTPFPKLPVKPGAEPKLCKEFSVHFFGEVTVNQVKFYFAQTSAQFALRVSVTDKKTHKVVYHKAYPPHMFVQFMETSVGETPADYALTLSGLGHKCSDLAIVVEFGGASNAPSQPQTVPEMAVEFYGKIDDQLEEKAVVAHKAYIQGKTWETDLYEQRGSLPMLRLKGPNEILYTVPVKDDEGKKEEETQQPAAEAGKPAAEEESKDDPPAISSDEQPESAHHTPHAGITQASSPHAESKF